MSRLAEIDEELKWLNRRHRDLLQERRQILADRNHPDVTETSQFWLEPIFSIIEKTPGISRSQILAKLNRNSSKVQITSQTFTNTLTTLRRRGWIENQGTRKRPKWYARGRIPRTQWNTRESVTR